jgi:hypothetical protein
MASFAGKQREEWMQRTWGDGDCPDPVLLAELRTRADAYRAIPDSDYKDWVKANGNAS